MSTIPIYVNNVEQGVCELTNTRKLIRMKLSEDNTLSADEVAELQSIWTMEYIPKDKIPSDVERVDFTVGD